MQAQPNSDASMKRFVTFAQFWLTWLIETANYIALDDDWIVYAMYVLVAALRWSSSFARDFASPHQLRARAGRAVALRCDGDGLSVVLLQGESALAHQSSVYAAAIPTPRTRQ